MKPENAGLLWQVCCAQLHSAAPHFWQNCYMDIGIIGSGKMGTGLGRLWAKHGHHVMFSYSRRPEKLENLVLEIGSHARSGTPRDAVGFANVLFLAVPWEEVKDAISAAGVMNGKTLISCVNPFGPRGLEVGLNTSAAEEISRLVPDAAVVEAFNTIFASILHSRAHLFGSNMPTVFYCGDDRDAKSHAAEPIRDAGPPPGDAGALENARSVEPLATLMMESGLPFDVPGVELTLETCWESLLPIGKSSSPKRICFGFPEAVSPKITFPRTSWICWISLGRLNSRRPRLKRVRFLGEVEMKERISMWEGEGGSVNETSEKALTGTVNQIEWAKQIRTQVNAEFDRVITALEAAATKQSGQDRMDTQTIIAILEEKRTEVMEHQEAGYFIHDWQELRDQVRQLIMKDDRYKAIKTSKVQL